jgi:hypothetical protein
VPIRDATLAKKYTANWQKHLDHSEAYGRGSENASASIAQKSTDAEPPAQTHQGSVRGNRRSHIYQWPACSGYDMIGEQNHVEFPSAQAAETAGYRPAHNCP